MLKCFDAELHGVEVFGIRPEMYRCAGFTLGDFAGHFQLAGFVTVGEGHVVKLPVAFDGDFELA